MEVAIQIPDDICRALALRSDNLSRAVLEAVAAEAYRTEAITSAQVQEMLGFSSRWETESFLKQAGAIQDYSLSDFESDIATVHSVIQR